MRRDDFIAAHRELWTELEFLLDELDAGKDPGAAQKLPAVYRRVCQTLSLARSRGYGRELIDELNGLVLRGYHQLYGRRVLVPAEWLRYALVGVIRQLRKDRVLFVVSMLLFYGPFLLTMGAVQIWPELAFAIAGPEQLASMEDMHASGDVRTGRESSSDLAMFGFYIRNNVGIGFRTFAGGALFGLGSLFFLLFNGVFLGAMIGHVMAIGHGAEFWEFGIGHGSFELTGIGLAGYCGLKVGLGMLSPGRRTRARAMFESAREAMPVVWVTFAMLTIAAFIEAFWSATGVPQISKFLVGGSLWLLVIAYLGRALLPGETR
ncbi:MAG: stage II sporulation protein M [Deltaproteobacteria bacterium]|nr:stage II sporulation protein M [Deltaproteobacteria bacterium]